jgi:Holliday junction resolvase
MQLQAARAPSAAQKCLGRSTVARKIAPEARDTDAKYRDPEPSRQRHEHRDPRQAGSEAQHRDPRQARWAPAQHWASRRRARRRVRSHAWARGLGHSRPGPARFVGGVRRACHEPNVVHWSDIPREWLALVALAALLLLLRQALKEWAARWRLRRRMRRARQGEREAPSWLEALGYAVVGSQVSGGYTLSVDGESTAINVRADFIVERAGVRYVAEVKTGQAAPRIQNQATRRQLLEYRMAFAVDGVLLIDAETRRVHVVCFPPGLVETAEPARLLGWLVATLMFGLGVLIACWR